MLGYILATTIGLILVALVFGVLTGKRTGPDDAGRPDRTSQPAADEPTPDWSVTATQSEVDAARRHTPPA